jgi:hypothetical protein
MALGVMDVLVDTDLYTFDFGKLSLFFEKADLVKKLNGYVQAQVQREAKASSETE